jgi:hypothetical protein
LKLETEGKKSSMMLDFPYGTDTRLSSLPGRNGTRRHMKKGQIATPAVKAEVLRLETEGEKKSMMLDFPHGTGVRLAKLAGCGHRLINDAILVFRYARELADEVISGKNPDMTLTDAVRIAMLAVKAKRLKLEAEVKVVYHRRLSGWKR